MLKGHKVVIKLMLIYIFFYFWSCFTTFGIRALDSRVSLLETSHRGIFAINFFYEVSEAEIFRVRSQNPEEHLQNISELGSQYFQRYDLWKLGLFAGSSI